MPCPDIRPLSEVPELNGIGLGNGILPNPDVPPIDEERWIEGNGGVIRFYSQGPVEAGQFSPEGLAAESLVGHWRISLENCQEQEYAEMDLVCNRMNFHDIPISFCRFDLAEIGRRVSGEGIYVDQHIDHHEDRIVRVNVRSLTISRENPCLHGPLDIQIGGEPGHTICQMISPGDGVGPGYGVYGVDLANNKPKVNEKARELLLSFLEPKQQQDYRKLGHFGYLEEAAKREWKFYFRYHYPVEFRNQGANSIGLCIELEDETPTEDILLMSLLEVRGGHGDKIIRAGHRDPQPLRDDQILHQGGSPEEGVIEFSGSEADLRRLTQRWSEAMERGRTTTRELGEAFRRVALLTHQFSQEYFQQEDRRTAIEIQNAEPLTLERLRECFQSLGQVSVTRKVSCSPEAYGDLIRRNDIVLNEGVSINIMTNDLYIGSLWGIELYVNPDQREPFRPMEG